ncbi:uncharacterized protein EKO05_0003623 [Ascochyta rabiei]|nr:uncharacterized protein EKO05_0003623 [Ascochyta rabiei]UPX13096.1 hypothetical protein EKO05_0003623 [Ascochyta rabiei]
MEVDFPTQPTRLASTHAGGDTIITAPPDDVYSLDDFLATHQAEHDARAAAREAADVPLVKKSKQSHSSIPPHPVAVGARSSKHTILLHEKYQALAIPQPEFTYGGSSDTRWTVEVSFPGLANAEELQGLKQDGRFNSKQEAKEAASKTALAILEQLEQAGRVTKAGKAKKPKGEPACHAPKEKEEPGENYVGQLLEFQRSTSAPQPTYTDYQLGTRWACLMEIEGHPAPFGSLDSLFGSKKIARQHAAGCAVSHFKDEGLWPEEFTDVGGIKKRKVAPTNATSSSLNERKASVASSSPGSGSATQQVASLSVLLNLGTPEWRYMNESPAVPDIHTVSCYFKNGGAHEGPIGEVRNIFGKKRAKEECARLTLQYLTQLKEKREEVGRRLMAGIAGGEGVAGVAVGKAMDGEKKGADRNVMEDLDDELDIYEDAMEH